MVKLVCFAIFLLLMTTPVTLQAADFDVKIAPRSIALYSRDRQVLRRFPWQGHRSQRKQGESLKWITPVQLQFVFRLNRTEFKDSQEDGISLLLAQCSCDWLIVHQSQPETSLKVFQNVVPTLAPLLFTTKPRQSLQSLSSLSEWFTEEMGFNAMIVQASKGKVLIHSFIPVRKVLQGVVLKDSQASWVFEQDHPATGLVQISQLDKIRAEAQILSLEKGAESLLVGSKVRFLDAE